MSRLEINPAGELLDSMMEDEPEDKLSVNVPRSLKKRLKLCVEEMKDERPYASGINISSFVRDAIIEKLDREGR